jgi:hypothetical protein
MEEAVAGALYGAAQYANDEDVSCFRSIRQKGLSLRQRTRSKAEERMRGMADPRATYLASTCAADPIHENRPRLRPRHPTSDGIEGRTAAGGHMQQQAADDPKMVRLVPTVQEARGHPSAPEIRHACCLAIKGGFGLFICLFIGLVVYIATDPSILDGDPAPCGRATGGRNATEISAVCLTDDTAASAERLLDVCNTCAFAFDGDCQEGTWDPAGGGSEGGLCRRGTDSFDCAVRNGRLLGELLAGQTQHRQTGKDTLFDLVSYFILLAWFAGIRASGCGCCGDRPCFRKLCCTPANKEIVLDEVPIVTDM